MDAGMGGNPGSGGKAEAGAGGTGGTGGASTGGKGGASTGTGGKGGASTGTGGKGGANTGGTGTGGKGGASTGGKGGASMGGKSGAGGAGIGGKGGAGGSGTTCSPDPAFACDNCIETKCCQEWLDCINDADCLTAVGGNQEEFYCIQDCLIGDGSSFPSIDECAATCQHDPVGVSAATSSIIACMRDTGDAGTQNCTTECFGREI
jgi:hypothetical protein